MPQSVVEVVLVVEQDVLVLEGLEEEGLEVAAVLVGIQPIWIK